MALVHVTCPGVIHFRPAFTEISEGQSCAESWGSVNEGTGPRWGDDVAETPGLGFRVPVSQ